MCFLQKITPLIDGLMLIILLLLMSFGATGQEPHEWLGISMGVLALIHNAANRRWYSRLFQGRYTLFRMVQTTATLGSLVTILALMISGLVMARYAVRLPLAGGAGTARLVHLSAAYWSFLFLSVHLGLHWPSLSGRLRQKVSPRGPSHTRMLSLRAVALALGLYGAYQIYDAQMLSYMLLTMEFAFFDPSQSVLSAAFDHVSMLVCLAGLSALALPFLRRR